MHQWGGLNLKGQQRKFFPATWGILGCVPGDKIFPTQTFSSLPSVTFSTFSLLQLINPWNLNPELHHNSSLTYPLVTSIISAWFWLNHWRFGQDEPFTFFTPATSVELNPIRENTTWHSHNSTKPINVTAQLPIYKTFIIFDFTTTIRKIHVVIFSTSIG